MQYRIVRNNKCSIGYRYYIQAKYFNLFWSNTPRQPNNEFDLDMAKAILSDMIDANIQFRKRKQTINNEVVYNAIN